MLLLAEATVSTSDRKPFSFFVASPIKVVNIWPSSKEERDEWMVAIKKVVRKPFDGVDIHLSPLFPLFLYLSFPFSIPLFHFFIFCP
jgi:hypothetical protein